MTRAARSYDRTAWVAILLPICLASCLSSHDSVAVDINPQEWTEAVVMHYCNTDTLSVKEAGLVIRYGAQVYPRTGTYIIEAVSPDGDYFRDTLTLSLTPDIRSNNLQETRIPYRTGIVLEKEGIYSFTVIPPEGVREVWGTAIDFKKLR